MGKIRCKLPLLFCSLSDLAVVSLFCRNSQMWAEFPGGFQCPLRPKDASEFEKQGYFKAHEGVHILRNNHLFEIKRQALLESVNQEPKKERKKEKSVEKKK
jgi:hypothetical protein